MARPEVIKVALEATADLVAGGPWSWVDDDLEVVKPWGFDLTEITVPEQVRYGAHDVLVPAAHGRGWHATSPGATEGSKKQRVASETPTKSAANALAGHGH